MTKYRAVIEFESDVEGEDEEALASHLVDHLDDEMCELFSGVKLIEAREIHDE
jgi:hypothetical protein